MQPGLLVYVRKQLLLFLFSDKFMDDVQAWYVGLFCCAGNWLVVQLQLLLREL